MHTHFLLVRGMRAIFLFFAQFLSMHNWNCRKLGKTLKNSKKKNIPKKESESRSTKYIYDIPIEYIIFYVNSQKKCTEHTTHIGLHGSGFIEIVHIFICFICCRSCSLCIFASTHVLVVAY